MSISENIKKQIRQHVKSKKLQRSLIESAEELKTKGMSDQELWKVLSARGFTERNLEDED